MRSLAIVSGLLLLCGAACASGTGHSVIPMHPMRAAGKSGTVTAGASPVAGAFVTLYRAGSAGDGRGAVAIAHARTDASGAFSISAPVTTAPGVLYYVATGGSAGKGANSAIALAAVSVPNAPRAAVSIDELSTVGFAYALAQFSDASGTKVGASATNAAGLHNAAMLDAVKLVDPASGKPAAFWPSGNACGTTAPPENCQGLTLMNSLANALAACDTSGSAHSAACTALRRATDAPANASGLAALHALVMDPGLDPSGVYKVASQGTAYKPALTAVPPAWTLMLKFVGNGHEFDGPGNVAIDANGNLWITNNYIYNSDRKVPACAGEELLELTPLGDDAPGAPFTGGGISGAGWGIAFDKRGFMWVGDFGFKGAGCSNPPPANAVSLFSDSGKALSPGAGYTNGNLSGVQGIALDNAGNLWMANNDNNSITVYAGGNPKKARNLTFPTMLKPFGLEVDDGQRIWISGVLSGNVTVLDNDGTQASFSPVALGKGTRPLGLAIDRDGNAWVPESGGGAIAVITPNGKPWKNSPVTGGGIATPWGVAVDGNDNVWVADFTGKDPRVSEICGVRGTCPNGIAPGKPISPATGYASPLLQRLTAVTIDASGNVWAADNWLPKPIPTNPGGDGMVLFVGLAGPVKVPAHGPVRLP
jgi:streptogramin lyase